MTVLNPRLGVSSWSLNRRLRDNKVSLLDLPGEVSQCGLSKLEICHFHFPSTDNGYLAELRQSFENSGVEFYTLLIDFGDLSSNDSLVRESDEAMMSDWLEIAAKCGAQNVRVIAGQTAESVTGGPFEHSVSGLSRLSRRAKSLSLRLVTENWHALLHGPDEVVRLLDRLEGRVGLKLDFGNWGGEGKHDKLTKIAPFAQSTHAKASFTARGSMNSEDFVRCLSICQGANFSGPHILIFDSPGDEWAHLNLMRDVVSRFL